MRDVIGHPGDFLIRGFADVVAQSLPHEVRFIQGVVQTAFSQQRRAHMADFKKRYD